MRTLNYWRLKEEIKRGNIKNSYLLIGENDFIKEEIIKLLETVLIEQKTKAFDKTKFYGDELPDDVYRLICSPPVVSKRHLSVIFNIDKIKQGKDQLRKALESSSPLLCIVLTVAETAKKKTFRSIEWFLNNIYTLKCGRFSQKEIERWLLETVKNKRADISQDAISLLWEFLGDDMFSLYSEVEKLLVFKPEGKIEAEDVKSTLGEERVLSIITLEEAIYKKDVSKGMKALENLFIWGEDPMAILYRLWLWSSSSLLDKKRKNSLGFDDARVVMSMLTEAELSIKRGEMEEKFALKEAVYKLTKRK